MIARTSLPLKILYSLPFNLISLPPYLLTSTRSPFLTSRNIFFPSSPVVPAPTATTMLSIGFSFAVSGMMIPPFLPFCSFSSMGSTRIRSPMGLTLSVIIYFRLLLVNYLRAFLRNPLPLLLWRQGPGRGGYLLRRTFHFVCNSQTRFKPLLHDSFASSE